ncbi:hypothetical protein Clacol_005461 [Clathrus columnatus]|uniref:Squalene cyclase C-terminal domain-containing protein n=1 Tax=Clathrus columnatus TaxID=1419009 RepID=A0AAV5AEV7_9AGAM|nr:hypothetical protein Clacol_005461 [Clathrus columnatus]
MVEYSCSECTSSVLTALGLFKSYYPAYRRNEIEETIERGIEYLHKVQHPNGCWVGNWGICFTYATMFVLDCLAMKNETYLNNEAVEKACNFLVSKQRPDGESYKVIQHYPVQRLF